MIIIWPVSITFYWTNHQLNLSPLTKIIEAIVGRDASINDIIIVREDFTSMSADPFYQTFVKIQPRIQNSPTFPCPRVSGLSYLVHGNLVDSIILSRTRYELFNIEQDFCRIMDNRCHHSPIKKRWQSLAFADLAQCMKTLNAVRRALREVY